MNEQDRPKQVCYSIQHQEERRCSAADTDLIRDRQVSLERSTAYDTHGAYTAELTDISYWE
jgi:hypothetical protein